MSAVTTTVPIVVIESMKQVWKKKQAGKMKQARHRLAPIQQPYQASHSETR